MSKFTIAMAVAAATIGSASVAGAATLAAGQYTSVGFVASDNGSPNCAAVGLTKGSSVVSVVKYPGVAKTGFTIYSVPFGGGLQLCSGFPAVPAAGLNGFSATAQCAIELDRRQCSGPASQFQLHQHHDRCQFQRRHHLGQHPGRQCSGRRLQCRHRHDARTLRQVIHLGRWLHGAPFETIRSGACCSGLVCTHRARLPLDAQTALVMDPSAATRHAQTVRVCGAPTLLDDTTAASPEPAFIDPAADTPNGPPLRGAGAIRA